MDANLSNPDDLKDLEQRLASWSPAREGLDPDAMLFAAGRASARGGKARLAWPIVSGCLAVVAVALGVRLAAERSERLALLRELHVRDVQITPDSNPEIRPSETPAPYSYIVQRREWERHPGDWQLKPAPQSEGSNRSALPETNILRAWQPNGPHEPL
jgi:hypothetical protein